MISTWPEAKGRRKKYPRAQEEKMLQKRRRFLYIKKRKNEKPTWKTEMQSTKRNVKCEENAKATAKYKIKMMQKKKRKLLYEKCSEKCVPERIEP